MPWASSGGRAVPPGRAGERPSPRQGKGRDGSVAGRGAVALAAGIVGVVGLSLVAVWGVVAAEALHPAPAVPPLVQPPGAPWLLGNTRPHPPRVTWSGPALVVVDAPEDLTKALLRRAPGGVSAPHLLYTDAVRPTRGPTWILVYVANAFSHTTLRVTAGAGPAAGGASGVIVRWETNGGAGEAPLAEPLTAGVRAVAGMESSGSWTTAPVQSADGRTMATRSWLVPPRTVLCVWQPVEVLGRADDWLPTAVWVWESLPEDGTLGLHPSVLPARPGAVVRATLSHAVGTVALPVPAHDGAWAWDWDNDAPLAGGVPGGVLCPPWVCLDGEVRTYGAAPFPHGADPLPGESEAGVDPVDAPGRAPATAVEVAGRLVRTNNYGDYGCLLRVVLRAPPGRRLYAALVPGFAHAAPWSGVTVTPGGVFRWSLPARFPPIGWGYEVVSDASRAWLASTVTPGAYAPWRLVVWSEPARAAAGRSAPRA